MLVYILVDIVIIFFGIIFGGYKCFEFSKNKKVSRNSKFFYFSIMLLLVFISGFRGDFTVDYNNYVDLFNRYDGWTIHQILSKNFLAYPETGYLVFQFVIKNICNNPILLFVITSIVIVKFNLNVIREYFPFGILPILFFLEMGNYYSSFNVMRQIFAASILLMGTSFLYKRELLKYGTVVLIAFSIHKSSLIMLPFYFFSNIKLKKKGILWLFVSVIVFNIFLPNIISLVQTYYWSWYNTQSYGMSGYGLNNLIAPVFIVIPPLLLEFLSKKNKNSDDIDNKVVNVWRNSAISFALFSILGLQIEMVQRIATFFSTYAIMYFCYIMTSVKTGKYKQVVYACTIILVIIYGFLVKVNTNYNPFYFIF